MNGFEDNFKEAFKVDNTYDSIERKIGSGALSYINKYYKKEIGTGTITILSDNLVEHNIIKEKDLITSSNDNCIGYALVRKDNKGDLEITPYINCSNYVTKDYQSWRVGEYE